MKQILFLILIFTSITIFANIRTDYETLDDFTALNGDTIHTLKIEIKNETNTCKLLYLTNDEEITGYSTKGADWRNPITFLGELCGGMTVDHKRYIPTVFTIWFKKMEPYGKFIFYFQYTGNMINPQKILDLIRITDAKNKQREIDDLSWKGDVLIIPLEYK